MTNSVASGEVRELNRLAVRWRISLDGTARFVPRFDPESGGTASTVLLLMESPGPSTVTMGERAVCSEDNPGPTAAALRRARTEAGLPREATLRWNLIPWALPGRPTRRDVEEGRIALGELLTHLPQLRAIVTFGTIALDGVMRHLTLDEDAALVPVIAAPHPSPANGAHRHEQHRRAVQALRLAHGATQVMDTDSESDLETHDRRRDDRASRQERPSGASRWPGTY